MSSNNRMHGIGLVAVTSVLTVGLLLVAFAAVIASGQSETRSRSQSTFKSRGQTTAAFAADYIVSLAQREQAVASSTLAGRSIDPSTFNAINSSFEFSAVVLLDNKGKALTVTPSDLKLIGADLAPKYAYLRQAEAGKWSVSNVVSSTVKGQPVVAVAVPYQTPFGRRVYSGAFRVAQTPLGQYLNHAVVAPEHAVYLIDASGTIISSNPTKTSSTISKSSPSLAHSIMRSDSGTFTGRFGLSTYSVSRVGNTSWRLVLTEPNSTLYSSTAGFSGTAPWLVFGAAALLALLLVLVFLRSFIDRRSLVELSSEMAVAAETDELTGLSNRRRLVAKLESTSAGARRSDEVISLLMIDLDKFKSINDSFGHEVGDRTLVAVASAMRSVFRDNDIYGRWGGDEFLAILPSTSAEEASSIANRLRSELLATSISTGSSPITISTSIGVASGTSEVDDLLRRADIALYLDKEVGAGSLGERDAAKSAQ